MNIEERVVELNNQAVSKIFISWKPVLGVTNYQVNYRFENGNFVSQRVSRPDFEIVNSEKGRYEVQVFSFNAALEVSATSADATFDAIGKTAVPSDITGLTYEPISDTMIRLKWNTPTDIDVIKGGKVYVRHSTLTNGNGTFTNAIDLVKALAGNTNTADVPLLEGEYILKAQDDTGNFSAGETSIVIDLPETQPKLVVLTRREDQDNPKFQGTKTNVAFDATTNSLNLVGGGQFDDITDFELVASLDDFGGIVSSGTYDFASTLDLGGVFSVQLRRHFLTEAFYPNDLINSRTANVDTWTDWDGSLAYDANAELTVRTTQTDPSGSPTYSGFQNFSNGVYKGRGFQFRANLTSNDPAQDIKVSQLGFTASFDRRTETSLENSSATNGVFTSSGATNITFNKAFFAGTSSLGGANSNPPSVGIQASNMASGDFFELSNITGTGFTVHFKNSSNASISRNFTYQATGFGKAA